MNLPFVIMTMAGFLFEVVHVGYNEKGKGVEYISWQNMQHVKNIIRLLLVVK